MKIKITKSRKGTTLSTSVRFSAQGDREDVDLKDIILSAAKKSASDLLMGSVEELGSRGYSGGLTKETRNTREFTLTRKTPAPQASIALSDDGVAQGDV